MPANVVRNSEDERHWKRAKEQAAKQGRAKDYAYIMGIFKKMSKGLEKASSQVAEISARRFGKSLSQRSSLQKAQEDDMEELEKDHSAADVRKLADRIQGGETVSQVLDTLGQDEVTKKNVLAELRRRKAQKSMAGSYTLRKAGKAGPYRGPRGGLWADSDHKIPYKPEGKTTLAKQKGSHVAHEEHHMRQALEAHNAGDEKKKGLHLAAADAHKAAAKAKGRGFASMDMRKRAHESTLRAGVPKAKPKPKPEKKKPPVKFGPAAEKRMSRTESEHRLQASKHAAHVKQLKGHSGVIGSDPGASHRTPEKIKAAIDAHLTAADWHRKAADSHKQGAPDAAEDSKHAAQFSKEAPFRDWHEASDEQGWADRTGKLYDHPTTGKEINPEGPAESKPKKAAGPSPQGYGEDPVDMAYRVDLQNKKPGKATAAGAFTAKSLGRVFDDLIKSASGIAPKSMRPQDGKEPGTDLVKKQTEDKAEDKAEVEDKAASPGSSEHHKDQAMQHLMAAQAHAKAHGSAKQLESADEHKANVKAAQAATAAAAPASAPVPQKEDPKMIKKGAMLIDVSSEDAILAGLGESGLAVHGSMLDPYGKQRMAAMHRGDPTVRKGGIAGGTVYQGEHNTQGSREGDSREEYTRAQTLLQTVEQDPAGFDGQGGLPEWWQDAGLVNLPVGPMTKAADPPTQIVDDQDPYTRAMVNTDPREGQMGPMMAYHGQGKGRGTL